MTDLIVDGKFIKADAKPPVGTTPTVVEETVNVKLLKDTLEYIKAFPQTWQQADWYVIRNYDTGELVPHLVTIQYEEVNSCGTAMCFAGHAALKEGFPAPPKTQGKNWQREVDGKRYGEAVEDFAAARLGLRQEVAAELFAPSNTLEVLEEMIDAIIENPEIDYWKLEAIRERILDDEDLEDEEDEDGW